MRVTRSYGAMFCILPYLEEVEQVRLQIIDKFFYNSAISRVQTSLRTLPNVYVIKAIGTDKAPELSILTREGLRRCSILENSVTGFGWRMIEVG